MIHRFLGEFEFLSNFHLKPLTYKGLTFGSAEAAFHSEKNPGSREKFKDLNPSDAKRLGRKLPLRIDWEEVKNQVMLEVLRCKFSDPELREKLLATEEQVLIEGNTWHDQYWGNCQCFKHKNIPGHNWLGKLLMQVRQEIRDTQK